MASKHQGLSGQRIAEIRSGLALIKDKRLPSGDAEALVASLWMLLEPAAKAFDEAVKKVRQRAPEIDAMEEGKEQQEALQKYRKDLQEIEDRIFEIRRPKTVLGPQHMPKTYKGEAGQMNAAGNAAAIIALRPEFYSDPAIEKLQDESTDTDKPAADEPAEDEGE